MIGMCDDDGCECGVKGGDVCVVMGGGVEGVSG